MTMRTLTTLLLTLTILTTTAQIHVAPTATGAGTGVNWANATTLENAMATATSGQSVWVHAGTYFLTQTLVIPQGVRVYGGFAGTETQVGERNFGVNNTVFNAGNNFAAVTMEPISFLSGVTIQNGVANTVGRMDGGGVLMRTGARLESSFITGNVAGYRGGAIFAEVNTYIFNTVIFNNRAGVDGFAVASSGNIIFLNNTVVQNSRLNCDPFQSTSTQDTICEGETITLSASQTGEFLWSTGAITPSITTAALAANTTFTVTITMPNFCIVTDTFHVVVNPAPTVTIAVNPPTANPGNMVTFTAAATPPGGAFLWSDIAATTGPVLTAQMPAVGDLQFTVNYTLNGCQALPVTATAVNTECVPPNIDGAVLEADDLSLCLGGTTTLRLTGGTRNSGYWVLFSGACGGVEIARTNLNNPTFSVSPTALTTYFVRGEGCGTETSCVQTTVAVLQPPMPTTAPSNTVCVGQNLVLTNPTADGGTWSIGLGGGLSIVTDSPNSVTVTGTVPGNRTVVFTATNGCQYIFNLEVLATPTPITGDTNICQGQFVFLTATPGGGIWSTAGGTSATVNAIGQVTASETLTGATVIQYTHPTTGCFVQQIVYVHQQPSTPAAAENQVCVGNFVGLNPPSPAGGVWSITPANLAEFDVGFTQITGLVAGTATVTYQFGAHCYASFELTVLPQAQPFSHTVLFCQGDTLYATATEPGGTWSSTNPSIATVNATTGAFTGVAAGTFSLVYTLANGCSHTSAPITVEATPVVTGATSVGVGLTTQLTPSPAGGMWIAFNPAVASVDATGLVTGVSAGTTTLRYILGNCHIDRSITVDACAAFTLITASANQEICFGATMLNITYNLSNATTSQITWSPTAPVGITFNSATHTISGTPMMPGTFTYTITSVNHPAACSPATASGTITVFPPVMPGVIAGAGLSICQGATPVEFTSTSAGGGGNPVGGSHQWQMSLDGANWSNIATATSLNHQHTALNATTHFRRVFNNPCGTVNSNTITVVVNMPPAAPTATITANTVCTGIPDGSITINATPDVVGFSLVGTPSSFQGSPTFLNLPGGSHTIFVQNAAGCISSATVTIANEAGNPELDEMIVTPGTTICDPHTGDNIVISPTFTNAGMSPTFQWSVVGGDNNISTSQSLTLTTAPTETTTFRITVTNLENACQSYFDQTIEVVSPPIITSQPVGGSICVGQEAHTLSVAVSPTGGHIYQWQQAATETGAFASTGQTSSSFTVANSPASALWYRVQVSMVGGICPPFYSNAVQVNVFDLPTVATTTPATICGAGTVSLSATANPSTANIRWYDAPTGGTPLATYASGATWTTPHITATTQFFAEAYNVGLCASATRTQVTATVAPPHTITPFGTLVQSVCQTGTITPIMFTPGGGATGTTITWSGASTAAPTGVTFINNQLASTSITAPAGTYYFTVTTLPSGGTCTPVTATGAITVNAPPAAVTVSQVPGCGTVTLNASGGAGGTIYWLQGAMPTEANRGTQGITHTTSTTATYFFRSRSDAGCWGTQSATTVATIPQPPTVTTVTAGARCGTGTVSLLATVSTGAVARWFTTETGGLVEHTGATFTTPTITTTTSFWVEAHNATLNCTSLTRTEVVATVNTPPTVTGTTGAARCGPGTITLAATVSAGEARWFNVPTGGSPLHTGASFTQNITGTTSFWVEAHDATLNCTSIIRTEVIATMHPVPTVTGTTPGARCAAGTVVLAATVSAGATPRWFATSTGGVELGRGLTFTTPSISTSTPFYVEAYNETTGCYSPRTSVLATIDAAPTVTGTTPGARCGTGTVALSATVSTGATARWFATPTGGAVLSTGLTFTTTSISATTSFWVEAYIVAASCSSAIRTEVVATVNAAPTVTGTTPGARCGTGTVTLTATVSAGTARWFATATGGAELGRGLTFTTTTITTSTQFYVEAYNETTGCYSSRTPVMASIHPIPTITSTTPGASCGIGSTVILSAIASAADATPRWFDAATGGTLLATAASFTTAALPATTTFWVEAHNATTGCSTATRLPVVATIADPHTISAGGGALTQSLCQSEAIAAITFTPGGGATGTTIAWTGPAGASPPAGLTFTGNQLAGTVGATATAGTYNFTVTTTPAGLTCPTVTSTGSITVNAVPTAVTVTQTPGCQLVALNATGGLGGTIFWQGTTGNGTSDATPSVTQDVTATGTYFFRSRSTAGCWGAEGSVTVTTITQPHTLALTSAAGTVTQTVGIGASITSITFEHGGGATATAVTWTGTGITGSTTTPPAGLTVATAGNITTISGTITNVGVYNFSIATVANVCAASAAITGTLTRTNFCNNNTPGWGASLGTITWGNSTNTNINTGAVTITGTGGRPTQVWSGAVFATACNVGSATNNDQFNGGTTGSFNADCRRSLHSTTNRGAAQNGDHFSWCAVVRFGDVLCPAPWRVPTQQDFINLDMNMGGNGLNKTVIGSAWNDDARTQQLITQAQMDTQLARYMPAGGTAAAPQIGGTWGGARFAGGAGGLTYANSLYWSSTEVSATNASNLLLAAQLLWPQNNNNKAHGFAVRCVR